MKDKKLYKPAEIESKWQKFWEENKVYSPDIKNAKKPHFNLMMFPYPSAEGMHVGNMYAFTGADVYGRFKRMQGYDVLEPIGLDGFGIHSENYALKVGTHPMEQAEKSEKNFYRQMHATGNSYDWTRTVETYDPEYYKWTQWLFIQMFKAGLAYRKKAQVNWCPSCKTVLADEQVISGECERCSSTVEKRDLEQWFFRITNYAERLLKNIEGLDWTNKVKIAQREWIGKSEGMEIHFKLENHKEDIVVYTVYPETIYGVTYMVIAPEHPLVEGLTTKDQKAEVEKYVKAAKAKAEKERTAEDKTKTGVFTGSYCINPVNGAKVPIWVADYVLAGYGTGAVMGVPGSDHRDFEFANKYQLPITRVIRHKNENVILLHGCPPNKEGAINFGEESTDNHWILWLRKTLRDAGYDVEVPVMPESWKPDYQAWKKEFEKLLITEESILIGHSCGASFLVRWLSETKRSVKKLILVAPAKIASEEAVFEKFYDFKIDHTISDRVKSRVVFISNDDERIVKSAKIYQEDLEAELIEIPNKTHFFEEYTHGEPFPELLEEVVKVEKEEDVLEEGILVNSAEFSGMETPKPAKEQVKDFLDEKKWGRRQVQYHLRDWLISRQRYWGAPIPMVFCESCATKGVSYNKDDTGWESAGWFPEENLPVNLPKIADYKPLGTGKAPLASHPEFYETSCPHCGGVARRETDVADTFLDSSWYFFRYTSTDIDSMAFDMERVKFWLPVHIYIGGAEHSVLHLLYARFVTMVLHDLKMIDFDEPFARFFAHGLIIKDGAKMSKSKGNVVVPDEYIQKYGADTLRTYLMFLGPFSQGGDFRDTGIEGMSRFLKRVWFMIVDRMHEQAPDDAHLAMMHKTIKVVTEDFASLSYNTAIARLMEWYNFLSEKGGISLVEAKNFLLLLAPFAPHMTEELWFHLNNADKSIKSYESIHTHLLPEFDNKFLVESEVSIVVQVNGKRRGEFQLKSDEAKNQEKAENQAREIAAKYLESGVKKIIFVPGKIINFVV